MSGIAWHAYDAIGAAPDLDAVGFLDRPVTAWEWMRIRRAIAQAVPPDPLRFTSYIGPDGQMVVDDDPEPILSWAAA